MLTNCDNFRDMGGIKTHDGHVLKEKKIIRSGKLSDLNDDDVVFLEKYGLKHDVVSDPCLNEKMSPIEFRQA